MQENLMIILSVLFICLIITIVSSFIAYKIGFKNRIKFAEQHIGSAEKEALKIIEEAKKLSETTKKDAILEAKDEIFKLKTDAEKEIKEIRRDIDEKEKRLNKKEESIEQKIEQIDKKQNEANILMKEAEINFQKSKLIKEEQTKKLEEIAQYTKKEAKDYIINKLDEELVHEKALKIKNFNQECNEKLSIRSKQIMSEIISRCAADHVSENAISVVSLPNDEMKGRIIGREGRNIRTLETLTGVDLIIDDTPETITISGFDPVRREIAKLTLKKLISDGRIHPTKIEEAFNKSTQEIEEIMKHEGEKAVMETGIHAIHPELVKLIGRLKYRTSYGQNILKHSIEVAHLAGLLANELGVDPSLARRAGLLHDIGKSIDHEVEGTHVSIGIEIAKKYKEHFEVIHGIESHHDDVEPTTIIACIVKASDAISAARPGARREDLQNYIKRLEKLEEIANSFDGVEKSFAIQAGREIRILVNPDKISDDKMIIVARKIVKKIESQLNYPGQIKVQIIREMRAIEFAK